MTLSIGVLGATGVYGRHLVPRLVACGYRVRALVRRPEAGAIAAACGAELHVADGTRVTIDDRPAKLSDLREGDDVHAVFDFDKGTPIAIEIDAKPHRR